MFRPTASALPAAGATVTAEIDWERRHRLMRMHTCLHLLCAIITGDVTGGQVSDGKGRLDFNLPDTALDKEHITAELNRLVREDHPVQPRWITDEELMAKPELVRTMSVKPPMGQRPRAAAGDRGRRICSPAAAPMWRAPARSARRSHEDREQGPPEPAGQSAHLSGVIAQRDRDVLRPSRKSRQHRVAGAASDRAGSAHRRRHLVSAGAGKKGPAEYDDCHIPGAVFFDIDDIADTDSDLPHMLPSPEKFASRVRKLGLGDGNRIVVYDAGPDERGAGLVDVPRLRP